MPGRNGVTRAVIRPPNTLSSLVTPKPMRSAVQVQKRALSMDRDLQRSPSPDVESQGASEAPARQRTTSLPGERAPTRSARTGGVGRRWTSQRPPRQADRGVGRPCPSRLHWDAKLRGNYVLLVCLCVLEANGDDLWRETAGAVQWLAEQYGRSLRLPSAGELQKAVLDGTTKRCDAVGRAACGSKVTRCARRTLWASEAVSIEKFAHIVVAHADTCGTTIFQCYATKQELLDEVACEIVRVVPAPTGGPRTLARIDLAACVPQAVSPPAPPSTPGGSVGDAGAAGRVASGDATKRLVTPPRLPERRRKAHTPKRGRSPDTPSEDSAPAQRRREHSPSAAERSDVEPSASCSQPCILAHSRDSSPALQTPVKRGASAPVIVLDDGSDSDVDCGGSAYGVLDSGFLASGRQTLVRAFDPINEHIASTSGHRPQVVSESPEQEPEQDPSWEGLKQVIAEQTQQRLARMQQP